MATAIATVDYHHRLHFDSVPLIDLRLFSQSELLSLSLCSSRVSTATASQNEVEDEVSTPKIDRSVFNESAGSRKQTFSRLRLAPRNSSQIRSSAVAPRVEPLDEDNSKIICLLKSLLNIQSHSSDVIDNNQQLVPHQIDYKEYLNSNVDVNLDISEGLHDVPIDVGVFTCSARKRKRGRPRKDEIRSENCWVIESYDKIKVNESKGESYDKIKMNVVSEAESSVNIPFNANAVASERGNRKRGRPRKDENRNKINVMSETERSLNISVNVNAVASETGKRKRGRPRKDENQNKIEVIVVSDSSQRKRKRGRPRKHRNIYFKKEIVVGENKEDLAKEVVMENGDGVVVDLVALANTEDPYGEELRRRTEGMEKREELLGFLTGLKGEWVSLRKKRKIVVASEFGNALPRGWKLMLCIKKKVGHVWLGCRQYISPNGRQFVSCKEISSYLFSLSGLRDASKPSAENSGDCTQLDNEMIVGNAVDLTFEDDKTGANLVFCSPVPSTTVSTEHEKQGTSLKINSPGENCNKQYSVSIITNAKMEKMTAATNVAAAKLGVNLHAETVLYNNQCTNFCGSSGERDLPRSTIGDSNNLSGQVERSQNWLTFSGSGQQLADNCMNGVSFSSAEEQKQEIGYERGFLSPNSKEKTFSCQNLEKRPLTSTIGLLKVDLEKDESEEPISGSGYRCTRLEDSVTCVKEQGSFIGCSTVVSGIELKFDSLNNNRVSASTSSEALQERSLDSGLHFSSGKDHTRVFNNNLKIFSSSMLRVPKLNDANKSWNKEVTIGFGNEHSMSKPKQPEDSEVGLLNLFGSEKVFGFDNNLTKVSARTLEVPKLQEVRNSGEQAHGVTNNYRVATGTVQESRIEDSENARNNEFMTAFSNHSRSGVDAMDELLWRTDEENFLLSGLTDASSRLLQSSGCFPTFGTMSDKGASELFSEKYDSLAGFEGLRPGSSEHMEYDFLTTQSSSHSGVSKGLSYESEMPQGFDSSAWVEKEALPLLPKIGSRYHVTTLCAWCRNEFRHEPLDTGAETGSVGFMCPTCKAKFSGSHSLF